MNNADFLMQKKRELEGTNTEFDKNKNEELAKNFHSLSSLEQELFLLNNCRLVFKEASRYAQANSNLQEDLISSGIVGLQKAIMSFDKSKKILFGTYATVCIRNEMFMFLRKKRKYQSDMELDAPIIDDDSENLTRLDCLQFLLGMVETEEDIIDNIYEQDILQQIFLIIDSLSEKDYFILMHSYGIGEFEKMKQLDIATELSISQAHVSRRRNSIVKKLRKQLKNNTLCHQ